jgi:hypothetical protein
VAEKMPSITVLSEGTFTSVFIDKKSKRKSQNSRNQGEGSGSVQNNDGSGRPKNIPIWIHNTDILAALLHTFRRSGTPKFGFYVMSYFKI